MATKQTFLWALLTLLIGAGAPQPAASQSISLPTKTSAFALGNVFQGEGDFQSIEVSQSNQSKLQSILETKSVAHDATGSSVALANLARFTGFQASRLVSTEQQTDQSILALSYASDVESASIPIGLSTIVIGNLLAQENLAAGDLVKSAATVSGNLAAIDYQSGSYETRTGKRQVAVFGNIQSGANQYSVIEEHHQTTKQATLTAALFAPTVAVRDDETVLRLTGVGNTAVFTNWDSGKAELDQRVETSLIQTVFTGATKRSDDLRLEQTSAANLARLETATVWQETIVTQRNIAALQPSPSEGSQEPLGGSLESLAVLAITTLDAPNITGHLFINTQAHGNILHLSLSSGVGLAQSVETLQENSGNIRSEVHASADINARPEVNARAGGNTFVVKK